MATTTRARLRTLLGIALGNDPRFYFSGSLTSTGGAAGATLIDTKIARFDRTRIINKHILLTSGAISGEVQRVSTISDDAVGTITPVRAFSAQVANAVTYEILPFDPVDMHNALQYAGRVMNSFSPLFLRDETLVVDNLISNWDFETFSAGAFSSWSSVGAPTLTQSTSYYVHGSNSANIAGAAGTGISQNIITVAGGFASIDQAQGKTLHVRGWLRATAASNARLRVTFDGSTYTNGPYHSGDDDWEGPGIHAIDVTIPVNATQMTVVIAKDVASDIQADVVVAWIDHISRYTLPTSFVFPSPHIIEQQAHMDAPNGDYRSLRYTSPPVSGRILRLEGLGRLTVPTTDTGTVEIDETRSELLIALAAEFLLRNEPGAATEAARWAQQAEELKRAVGVGRRRLGANKREGWDTSDESGVSYLTLTNR